MPVRHDRRRATVVAFDAPGWAPPDAVVVDTNVVAEALLRREPEHDVCDELFRQLAQTRTLVVFSRLLEEELWEVVFNHALRTHTGRRDTRHSRYRRQVRHAASMTLDRAIRDMVTRDAGFAVLLPEDATLHTTRRRLSRTRARRRDACGE